eukprot:2568984-Rhodomonas_salina.1
MEAMQSFTEVILPVMVKSLPLYGQSAHTHQRMRCCNVSMVTVLPLNRCSAAIDGHNAAVYGTGLLFMVTMLTFSEALCRRIKLDYGRAGKSDRGGGRNRASVPENCFA